MANNRRSALKRANNKTKKSNPKPQAQVAENSEAEETLSASEPEQVEKSDVVFTEVKTKLTKEEKKKAKLAAKQAKAKKQAKAEKPKKVSRVKGVFSELKKVSWPTFPKAVKQTGAVIAVVFVFMVVTLGVDLLVDWIIKLLASVG